MLFYLFIFKFISHGTYSLLFDLLFDQFANFIIFMIATTFLSCNYLSDFGQTAFQQTCLN